MPRESSGKPRGKTSAYGYFVKMCYSEHKNKYPNETVLVTEISKKCAEKWKTMTPHEKQRFHELAQKDAERYNAECTALNGAAGGASSVGGVASTIGGGGVIPGTSPGAAGANKRKRSKKDPHAPKRALSAFFLFSRDRRPEVQQSHPEWKVGQIAQELGRQWKEIDEETKRKYDEMAQSGKSQYESDMRDYKAGKKIGSSTGGMGGNPGVMAAVAASGLPTSAGDMYGAVGGGGQPAPTMVPANVLAAAAVANHAGGGGEADDDDDEDDEFVDDD